MTLLRRSGFLTMAAVALAAALALGTNVIPIAQIRQQRSDLQAARIQLGELELTNRILTARARSLDTPVEIERIARERLGYVRPGETAFVVMDPPEQPTAEMTTTQTESVLYHPWYSKIWAFLTGADL